MLLLYFRFCSFQLFNFLSTVQLLSSSSYHFVSCSFCFGPFSISSFWFSLASLCQLLQPSSRSPCIHAAFTEKMHFLQFYRKQQTPVPFFFCVFVEVMFLKFLFPAAVPSSALMLYKYIQNNKQPPLTKVQRQLKQSYITVVSTFCLQADPFIATRSMHCRCIIIIS